MNIIRRTLLAAALLATALVTIPTPAAAQTFGQDRGVAGTWYLFITIDGAPPCQCTAIEVINPDGTVEGPANDQFSSGIRGVWAKSGDGKYDFKLLYNIIDKDGNADGLTIIKYTLNLTGVDSGTGNFTFQVLSNGGTVTFNGTGKVTATRIHP